VKLNRRDLRRLIESVINEDAASSAAKGAKAGALTGGGLGAYLGSLAAGVGGPVALDAAMMKLGGLQGAEIMTGGTAVQNIISGYGLTADAVTTAGLIHGAAASAAAVGLAGFAGYALGDYINDIMTGNTGTEEEKFLNSFKKSAKLTIGELGTSIFGFELDWDTMDDGEYMTAAAKKKYKGLNPRDIDKDRLKQLTTAIVGHRNFSESGKLPKGLADLFDFGYLNAETFKPFIEKAEKKKLDKMMAKLKEAGTKKKEATNESLSRGSLYRRRYHGRY